MYAGNYILKIIMAYQPHIHLVLSLNKTSISFIAQFTTGDYNWTVKSNLRLALFQASKGSLIKTWIR